MDETKFYENIKEHFQWAQCLVRPPADELEYVDLVTEARTLAIIFSEQKLQRFMTRARDFAGSSYCKTSLFTLAEILNASAMNTIIKIISANPLVVESGETEKMWFVLLE